MKRIALVLAALAAVVFATLPGLAQENIEPEKRTAITKMLEMTGAMNLAVQFSDGFIKQINQQFRQSNPGTPARTYEIIEEEVHKAVEDNLPDLLERAIRIYDRYFTLAELNDMIAFYETPSGRRSIEVLPELVQESMIMGQAWAQTITPAMTQRIQQRLADEGLQ